MIDKGLLSLLLKRYVLRMQDWEFTAERCTSGGDARVK